MHSKAVLLIDDDAMLLRLMSFAFRAYGWRVHTALEGGAGLQLFHTHAIDLVVTDLVMPDKEGIETIVELRKHDPEVKIIAISGGNFGRAAGYLTMAGHLGANAVLAKPFRNGDLVALAESLTNPPPAGVGVAA